MNEVPGFERKIPRRGFLVGLGTLAGAFYLPAQVALAESDEPRITEKFENWELMGTGAFIEKTKDALTILKTTSAYPQVKTYIPGIRQGTPTGTDVRTGQPIVRFGDRIWQGPFIWYVSAIPHESEHCRLYYQAKLLGNGVVRDNNTWAGVPGERQALTYQLNILKELGADQFYLDFVESLIPNPVYQNIPVEKRDW